MEELLALVSSASSQQKWNGSYKVSTTSKRPLENETQCIIGLTMTGTMATISHYYQE